MHADFKLAIDIQRENYSRVDVAEGECGRQEFGRVGHFQVDVGGVGPEVQDELHSLVYESSSAGHEHRSFQQTEGQLKPPSLLWRHGSHSTRSAKLK
ncbi:hypothetical protein CEXT_537651 [Caerostris extrusa]|uniref:Uncharacterized protein n=1 Tax=Caerostris extrusa TaxID=172846 RepID=A0AAV4UE91_CAEEX|nr:hypothetical protein CEXT_537651 [Caerostris extrusa]